MDKVLSPPQLPQPAQVAPADAAIQNDVTITVLALLNETGYSGSVNDANVQEIVKMLMNGTVPTDADLMRLGIIPTHAPVTTPPTYTIPVANPLEPVINLLPPVTPPPPPTPAPTIDLTAAAQSGAGANTLPSLPGGFPFPSNVFPGLVPPTTPKPFDPFGQSILGNQLPPNSIAPKPAPVDLLSSFNFPSTGTSGGMAPPPSGILDTQYQQQQQRRQQGMNPMMMMMMLAPEMMETMLSGENPMLTMMFMQSMQQSQRPHPPATPPMGSPLTPGSGFPSAGAGAGGFMDPGFGGMPAPGAAGSFMDLNSLTGANTVPNTMGGAGTSPNLMPLLNMINQPAGSPALPGLPPTGSALPPMDMASLLSQFGTPPTGGAAAPTGATGPTDMNFANLISPGTQPTGVSPTLDPFGAMG
ncbi:unnamed protein product [Lymnaea stagnalis]|uniref:Uncharacterized protein n=1 Tax=Lymnaea stagnalis TaxID=6523 RepID=A0AAV2HJV0_LYMST